MQTRRSFLGSVLGFVASTPFLAALPDSPWQRPAKLGFRALFRERASGLTVQAPGIASIDRVGNGFCFRCEPLAMARYLTLDEIVLLKADGTVIKKTGFDRACTMPGDTLTVTNTFAIDDEWFPTLDSFIERWQKLPPAIRDKNLRI